jgi:hypothetical protein
MRLRNELSLEYESSRGLHRTKRAEGVKVQTGRQSERDPLSSEIVGKNDKEDHAEEENLDDPLHTLVTPLCTKSHRDLLGRLIFLITGRLLDSCTRREIIAP